MELAPHKPRFHVDLVLPSSLPYFRDAALAPDAKPQLGCGHQLCPSATDVARDSDQVSGLSAYFEVMPPKAVLVDLGHVSSAATAGLRSMPVYVRARTSRRDVTRASPSQERSRGHPLRSRRGWPETVQQSKAGQP